MFPASAWAKLVDLGLHRRICDVYLSHGASQIDEAPVAAAALSGMGVEWCRAVVSRWKRFGQELALSAAEICATTTSRKNG
ncbi:hypothetical protein HMPREF2909_07340 [Alloscardovia sp. HMSC034E08]|nr:hypothetical protein HMPREF2909_07340 [Alloscardovia sp. HMSC034E08]